VEALIYGFVWGDRGNCFESLMAWLCLEFEDIVLKFNLSRSEAGWEIKKGRKLEVISSLVRFSSGSKDLGDFHGIPNSRIVNTS
jgi:hypothetical protein